MLKILTAGESHGKYLVGILEGLPAGIQINREFVADYLRRRRGGYGRGRRMNFEADEFEIIGGVIKGKTTGAPVAVLIKNSGRRELDREPKRTIPRPGHADFAGALKFDMADDFVPIIERSSARETAVRTAVLAFTVRFLQELGIKVLGYSISIGNVRVENVKYDPLQIEKHRDKSIFYFPVPGYDDLARKLVDEIMDKGDTLGGVFEVSAFNLPPGLGSHTDPDRKLDGRLASVIMSLNAVKGVEIGQGIEISKLTGSKVIDEFVISKGVRRTTNNLGGLEGGMTNGEPLIVRGYMKPISTMRNRRMSFDFSTLKQSQAPYIRSDTVVVPAASVIAETLVSFVLANAILEKFGGDTLKDVKSSLEHYNNRIKKYFR